MKKFFVFLVMGLILTTSSMGALATEKKQSPFDKIDTNKDGKIDLEEYKNRTAARNERAFKKADTNGDGYLSKEEMQAMRDNSKKDKKDRQSVK